MRERIQTQNDPNPNALVKCMTCNGFYEKTYWSRHARNCGENGAAPIPAKLSEISRSLNDQNDVVYSDDFKVHILNKFRDDESGLLCQRDSNILRYGVELYDKIKSRAEKQDEVRKSVRSEMRKLGNLYLACLKQSDWKAVNGDASDIVCRDNMLALRKAILDHTTKEDDSLKCSLKASLYYTIKGFASSVSVWHLLLNNDEESRKINDFLAIFERIKSNIFLEATQKIHQSRQIRLRKPSELPVESDILKLREYLLKTIETYSNTLTFMDATSFVELRDAVCARLTLFNARRGGEPARLLLSEWRDAEAGAWVDQQRISKIDDPVEKKLLNTLKIAYQMGKGNYKLVSVLIPLDCQKMLRILTSESTRNDSNVLPANQYVFPSTQMKDTHASGWHVVHGICKNLDLKSKNTLTATKQRHRVPTFFATLDLPDKDREAFYSHMGHAEDINKNVYQIPMAIQAITTVGKHLTVIDEGIIIVFINSAPTLDSSCIVSLSCIFNITFSQIGTNCCWPIKHK